MWLDQPIARGDSQRIAAIGVGARLRCHMIVCPANDAHPAHAAAGAIGDHATNGGISFQQSQVAQVERVGDGGVDLLWRRPSIARIIRLDVEQVVAVRNLEGEAAIGGIDKGTLADAFIITQADGDCEGGCCRPIRHFDGTGDFRIGRCHFKVDRFELCLQVVVEVNQLWWLGVYPCGRIG